MPRFSSNIKATGAVLVALAIAPAIAAQNVAAGPDPVLIEAFLRYQAAVSKEVGKRNVSGDGQGARLTAAMARQFGISVAEAVSIQAISSNAIQDLADLQAQGAAYALELRSKGMPVTRSAFAGFEASRGAVVDDSAQAIRDALSDQSWTALKAYISSEFASGLTIGGSVAAIR